MKKFEVGERVQFIYAGKLLTGRINDFSQVYGELHVNIEADDDQVYVKAKMGEIAKLDQPEPQSEKVKKINEIMLELIHRKDMDILSDDDITRMLIEALDIVNTLDEPKPVKVPKYVAEFIKRYEKVEDEKPKISVLDNILRDLYDKYQNDIENKVLDWIARSSNLLTLIDAVRNGYVVEEEPKYYVKLLPMEEGFLNLLTETETYDISSALERKGFKTKFTEKEIKAIDERLWAFAVPVEEVEVSE